VCCNIDVSSRDFREEQTNVSGAIAGYRDVIPLELSQHLQRAGNPVQAARVTSRSPPFQPDFRGMVAFTVCSLPELRWHRPHKPYDPNKIDTHHRTLPKGHTTVLTVSPFDRTLKYDQSAPLCDSQRLDIEYPPFGDKSGKYLLNGGLRKRLKAVLRVGDR
jgi:hypothetical protein